jgi:hypothetical protein
MAEDGIQILCHVIEMQSSSLGISATDVIKSLTLQKRENNPLITYPSLCSICDDQSD